MIDGRNHMTAQVTAAKMSAGATKNVMILIKMWSQDNKGWEPLQ